MKECSLIIILFLISYQAQILNQSLQLKGSTDNQTISNVLEYVDSTIEYKFFYQPQPLSNIWKNKIGDCTDQATLIKAMLKNLNIRTYKVHGYCNGYKHDWLRYNSIDVDNFICTKRTYKGIGQW